MPAKQTSSPTESASTKREKQTALGDDTINDSVDGNSVDNDLTDQKES